MGDFDNLLKRGFERLIGRKVLPKKWCLAQLPPKYGGMSIRSGLRTHGAHHLTSLVKTAPDVSRIVGDHDLLGKLESELQQWLDKALNKNTNIAGLVATIQEQKTEPDVLVKEQALSVAQQCELHELERVCRMMSKEELIHMKAHSDQQNSLVRILLLIFEKW